MTSPNSGEITDLLHQIEQGNSQAYDRLARLVRGSLKRIAANRLRRERPGHFYQTSDLVQEAYLRLFRIRNIQWEGRQHFFKVAALQMRRILVEYVRRQRPEDQNNAALDDIPGLTIQTDPSILKVNDILNDLAKIDARLVLIVELRYFGGFKIEEISEITGIPVGSVKRYWATAKAFIKLQLGVKESTGAHSAHTLLDRQTQ
ncbi:MAG: ECF-type sigma factor [Acidobacteriota bacterium]|nr:ECF-type sigma factor [Acidobacteriota bacterium]